MPLNMPTIDLDFTIFCRKYDVQPIYAVVAGSHSWGLEGPNSDIDVRGIYGWPLRRAVSLYPGRDNIEVTANNLDIQAYELVKVLRMLCSANGNVVEMLLNPLRLYKHPRWGAWLRYFARQCLTKRLVNYYRGYATSQRKRAMQNRGGKALVYTYREIFSGIHLMQTGEIIFDFGDLRKRVDYQSDLLDWALRNRHTPTSPDQMKIFEKEWQELTVRLDVEVEKSSLPEREPDSFRRQCDALLWEYRSNS